MSDARESAPRWYATPLDRAAAAARAQQLDALAEPDRLRVLSGVASRPDGRADATSLAGELDLEPDEVEKHLAVLTALELLEEVTDRPGTFTPTAETWMRFSRLIVAVERPGNPAVSRSERRASVGSEVELPPVLRRITERLAYRFSSTFSKETVERYVADSYRLLAERARVSEHLPSLTTRFVEDRLNALAVASGRDLRGTPEVLFVCVQNAGRSQMAAALLRQMAGDQVHVRTAGSRPSGQIDPVVVEVLDEIGVPVVAEFPKPLTDEVVQAADFVITMGCGDACPIYPGRRYMDWPVADPVGQPLEEVHRIRDEIAARLTALCQEMGISLD
ncbi:MAG TPA: arsenate reductase ArsC [Propionibacteriaceae bacterium]|nr:arsenate reductase ArsC [Propionibacteriaceae bacterium]